MSDERFANFWNERYLSGDHLELWEEDSPSAEFGKLLDALRLPVASRVLDLGCGTGLEALSMARRGWQVSGIDISPEAIRLATQRATGSGLAIELHCGNVLQLPWELATFRLLTDRGCLHLIPQRHWPAYGAEAARVLQPGGLLLLRGCSDPANPDFSTLSAALLRELLLPAGFALLSTEPSLIANRRGGLPAVCCLLERCDA
ncbi:MAG: class I SAM-dependent methyltransferase [bacterium]